MNAPAIVEQIRLLQRDKPDGWRKTVRSLMDGLLDNDDTLYVPPFEGSFDDMSGRPCMGHIWSLKEMSTRQELMPSADGRLS